MWVKATDANSKAVFINLAQARLIRPTVEGEGAIIVFHGGEEVVLNEPPAKLLIGLNVLDAQPPRHMTAEERREARRLSRL